MNRRPPLHMSVEARVPLPPAWRVISAGEALDHPALADLRRGVPLLAGHQPHSCWDSRAAGLALVVHDVVALARELANRRGDTRGRLMIQDIWHDMLIAPRLTHVAPGADAWWIQDRLHPNGPITSERAFYNAKATQGAGRLK